MHRTSASRTATQAINTFACRSRSILRGTDGSNALRRAHAVEKAHAACPEHCKFGVPANWK